MNYPIGFEVLVDTDGKAFTVGSLKHILSLYPDDMGLFFFDVHTDNTRKVHAPVNEVFVEADETGPFLFITYSNRDER